MHVRIRVCSWWEGGGEGGGLKEKLHCVLHPSYLRHLSDMSKLYLSEL